MSAENIRILNTTKELPSNIEAEQIILGSILVNNEIFDEISTIVNENIFFDPIHQKIFHYLNKLISKGLLASPITLKNYLENEQSLKELGGNEYIAKLTRLSTSAFQAKDYAKVIYDLHLRRKLIELSENTLTEANNKNLEHTAEQLIEGTEKKLFDLKLINKCLCLFWFNYKNSIGFIDIGRRFGKEFIITHSSRCSKVSCVFNFRFYF